MSSTAEHLNRECACISVDAQALQRILEEGPHQGLYASILAVQPHLFADVPVFVARRHVDEMIAIVDAIESLVATPAYLEAALASAPAIAGHAFGPRGVFYGYDFHLGSDGPRLIEINSNAGGALLNARLAQAQKACCSEISSFVTGALPLESVVEDFVAMFRQEWALQRATAPLRTIAIVDESPQTQYLYPEFLLFQELFRRAGLEAWIVGPEGLRFDGDALWTGDQAIDLVYNRLTDFYFEAEPQRPLREAYQQGKVVVTPHPRGHALYADKRRLVDLSDPTRLAGSGLATDTIAKLIAGVPRTVEVTPDNRAELWAERKRYFFKTVAGYGGKAAYRGDKLTHKTWTEMADRAYIAQEIVRPSERTIEIAGERIPLKLDVRLYVYDGRPQLLAARLYQGQTTNFRTPGGGFAPVFTAAG